MKQQQASHGILWRVGTGAADILALYAVHSLVAKSLGSADYGLFGVLMAVILWIRVFSSSAFLFGVSRFLPDSRFGRADVIRKGVALHGGLLLLLAAGLFFLAQPLSNYVKAPALAPCFRIFAAETVCYGFMIFMVTVLQSLRYFRESALILGVHSFLQVTLAVLVIRRGEGLAAVCLVYLIANMAAAAVALILIFRIPADGSAPSGRETLSYKTFFSFSLYQFCFSLLFGLTYMTNMVLAKRLGADAAAIGHYAGVQAIARAPYLLVTHSLASILIPITSEAFSRRRPELVLHYARQAYKFFILLFMPFLAAFAFSGRELLAVAFKPEFASAHAVLGLYFAAVMGMTGILLMRSLLLAKGLARRVFWSMLGVFTVHLILANLLIPRWEVTGAALALLLAGWGGVFAFYAPYRNEIGHVPSAGLTLRVIAAAVLSALGAGLLPRTGWWLAAYYTAGAALYGVLLFVFKAVSREDLDSVFRNKKAGL
jgi:O-antigen/teichoic acid export membrane protein